MAESLAYIKDNESSEEIKSFIEKFVKISPEKAKELRSKIDEMELIKLREEHVVKIIDLLPENQEDLNKICNDISFDEDETKKIIQTIKEFK